MKNSRFTFGLGVRLFLFFLCTVPLPALADNPQFKNVSASLATSGDLSVSFKEVGLGNNQAITYEASGHVAAEFVCVNRGGSCPAAANKKSVSEDFLTEFVLTSGKNGQITAKGIVVYAPDPGDFSCPGGQVVKLNKATYSALALEDVTTPVSAAISQSLSVDNAVCN